MFQRLRWHAVDSLEKMVVRAHKVVPFELVNISLIQKW